MRPDMLLQITQSRKILITSALIAIESISVMQTLMSSKPENFHTITPIYTTISVKMDIIAYEHDTKMVIHFVFYICVYYTFYQDLAGGHTATPDAALPR